MTRTLLFCLHPYKNRKCKLSQEKSSKNNKIPHEATQESQRDRYSIKPSDHKSTGKQCSPFSKTTSADNMWLKATWMSCIKGEYNFDIAITALILSNI